MSRVHEVEARVDSDRVTREQVDAHLTRCPDAAASEEMIRRIDAARMQAAADEAFDRLISSAAGRIADGDLAGARTAIEEALRQRPDDAGARDLLARLTSMEAEADSGERQFIELKEQADKLFGQGRFAAALISYESAQLLHPNDPYVADRIQAIKDSLNQLERISNALKRQYQSFRQKGDSLFSALKFEEAQVQYQTALAINPDDDYVRGRLEAIEQARSELVDLITDENGIFLVPEVPPQMLDETELLKQVSYPRLARNNSIEGRVVVRMLVDEQGRTSQHTIVKGIGYGCDDEAIRVLQMARFTPATYRGQPVKAWHNYPITFKLLR